MNKLPISIRTTPPHPEATLLTGTNPDGFSDGFHTGGAWLWNDKVYKPLDGRPYANADFHLPTQEAEMLEVCQDLPFFPKNWGVEEHNGRRFLVRPKAHIFTPQDYKLLNKSDLLQLEQSIREANRRTWEVNDIFVLGYLSSGYFLVDLSACQQMKGTGCYAADEEWRVLKFFEHCDYEGLATFRRNARHAVCNIDYLQKSADLNIDCRHVYASFNRPFSLMWASLPCKSILIHRQREDYIPHTWVCTEKALPESVRRNYELTWGWEPIH